MTWAQYVATGSGALAFRLDVAALPTQFVGLASQAAAASFGVQARTRGLKVAGQKLRERADVIHAKIEAGSMKAAVVDVDNLPSSYLGKVGHPTATTWLAANATAAATTITVSSTTDFAATNGYIWIDSECISYTGVTATTFTGCTRGVFNTLAQAHYIADGASLRYPAVTNQPITLEGQRARLYAYGELDSPTGDGTLIWTGVVSSDPRYDGTAWSIGIDPLTRLLNQKLGSAGSASSTSRGIYYPANAPFSITFFYGTLGFWEGETEQQATITFPTATTDTAFFENNAAFCDYLNDKIAADSTISTWLGTIRAAPDGDSGWHMELTTDSGTARAIRPVVSADRFGVTKAQLDQLERFPINRATGAIVNSVAVSTQYVIPQVSGFGVVPRTVFIADSDASIFPGLAAVFSTFPDGRLYTGGAVAPPAGTRGVILGRPSGERDYIREPYTVSSGRIDITVSEAMRRAARYTGEAGATGVVNFFGPCTLDYVVIHYERGGVGDFVEALISSAPTDLNLGAGPDLRTADIDYTSFARYGSGDGSEPFLNLVHFAGLPKHTIGEVLSAECQAAGMFLRIDATTGITGTKIKSPIASEATAATIPNILTKSLPTYEHSARGLVNTVAISTGYDPAEDEWTGRDFIVRDVASFGRSPHARTVSVKRLTVPNYASAAMTAGDAVNIASRVFGLYGGSYAEVTVDVPLTFYAVRVGSVVSLTAPNIPDTDGTIGISSRAGIVVGREHDLTGGVLTLTIVISDTSTTGYAPAAQIATETNTSGNIWDVTLANTEAPTGTTSVDWFAVGDAIRVWKFDNATPATQTGDITAISGSTITISLDGAAVLGTGDWILEYDAATAWATNPDPPFLFLGSTTGRVSLPTALPAWVFSP